MKLRRMKITNLASFVDFENDKPFKKRNLIFGTNGSGKSTLVGLLQLLDKYKRFLSTDTETELKLFMQQLISKESKNGLINFDLTFDDKIISIKYKKENNTIETQNDFWTPIKVFNDLYTNSTIGETFQMDLQNRGVLIGKVNIELDKNRREKENLEKQLKIKMAKAEQIVDTTIRNYRQITSSTAKVRDIISIDNLLNDSCDLHHDPILLNKRKKLGTGKTDDAVPKLDEEQFKLKFDIKSAEQKCLESVFPPEIDIQTAELLKRYTEFFESGLEIFDDLKNAICPFCRRDWPDSEIIINRYREYLGSTYNQKRADVKSLINLIDKYKDQVERQIPIIERVYKDIVSKAEKYDVDISSWITLKYDQDKHNKVVELLKKKYNNMEISVSILNNLLALQQVHLDVINNNNQILVNINKAIGDIVTRRKNLNKKLIEHFAKQMWIDNEDLRKDIKNIQQLIINKQNKIDELELQNPPQDTVREVFNNLLSIIGLYEYHIDENRRLKLKIDKEYDISNEGKRISSAQRKILSLCYFFAEIVSEISDVKQLKEYILIFDDPVDSADYVYFHSITTVIEKAETIFSKILNNKVKFGQFFVLTHNSLLYDRLTACRWDGFRRVLRKENGTTKLCPSEKSINNYCEYIRIICQYYKNPVANKTKVIYIGNIIRRVLEILSSFENLGSNDFQTILDGMGKTRLALLANHLSHDSFTKVLNPLSTPGEVKEACKDVLEVIEEKFPGQYETIKNKFNIRL